MNATSDAPGADDDASGVAVVIEAARVLSRYKFAATFTTTLLVTIARARRRRLWGQMLMLAAVVLVAALDLRPILETAAAAVRMAGEVSPAWTELLSTPWGWVASMLAGIWLLLRLRPSRR